MKTVLQEAYAELLDRLLWGKALWRANRNARKRRGWEEANFLNMWYWENESKVEALR